MSTANVVSILQAKMKRLPRHCQKLIQLAACLGPSFRVSPLQHLWSSHSSVTVKERGEDISLLLDQLTSEQFLENSKHRSDTYRFVHDMVQESALSLCSSQSAHFRAEIGWILFDSLEDSELEQMIFEVVDLINQGRIVRPNLVHVILNFRAAKKARSLSAFESAASYIARCIGLLPEDKWTNHRDLTLSVFTLGVEMEVALGRDHIMEELVEEVNGQKNLSCLDKVQIFFAKTQKLCNCDLNYAGTVDLSLEVLKDLGFPLPSNPITLPLVSLWAFYRTGK
jgi:predicted ATPase